MLHELRCFLLVVEHGTFTVAARHAHLAQPSLSAAIQRLEEELGARLLHRLPRGARPTAEGLALIPHARAALAAVEGGRRAVREVVGLQQGEVRLGGGATACTFLLPAALAAFRALHPGIRIQLLETSTPAVATLVEAGELDLGITQDLGEPWFQDELILVAAPGVSPSASLIAFVRGTALRALVDQRLPGVEIGMELGSIGAIKGMVGAGMGVALLSRFSVAAELARGEFVCLPHPATPVRRQLGILDLGVERRSPAAAALRSLLLRTPPVAYAPAR